MVSCPCPAGRCPPSHSLIPIPQQHRRRKYGKAPRWRWKEADCLWVITMSKSHLIWRKLIKCITYGVADWVGETQNSHRLTAIPSFLLGSVSFLCGIFCSPPSLPEWCREMGQGELCLAHNNLSLLLPFPHIIPMLQHGLPPPGARPSQTAPKRVLPTGCSSSVLQKANSIRQRHPQHGSSIGCSLCSGALCVWGTESISLCSPWIHSTLSPNFQAFNRIVGCHQIIRFPGCMKNYKIILPLYFYNIGFFSMLISA